MALDLRDFGNVSGSQPYMFSPTQFHGVLVTDLDTLRGRFPDALVECSGYSAQLDGGGGVFRWNEGSAAATDGGLIVGSTVYGRWNRVYDGVDAINPCWFGADKSGNTDSTIAIQAAINAAGASSSVRFPAGIFQVRSTITIAQNGVQISGSGNRATQILFAPNTTPDVCFDITAGASVLYLGGLRDLFFFTYDTTRVKTAVRVVDTSGYVVENIHVLGSTDDGLGTSSFWGGGGGSIGIEVKGREFALYKNLYIAADKPLVLAENPNNVLDCDHHHFQDLYLTANGNSCITINDAMFLTDVTFDGAIALVKGTYGLYWNSPSAGIGASYNVRLVGFRHEQATGGSPVAFYIAQNAGSVLQTLTISDCYPSTEGMALYLRNVLNTKVANTVFAKSSGVIIDATAPATGSTLTFGDCTFNAGSSVTLTNWRQVRSVGKYISGAPIAPTCEYVYQADDSTDYELTNQTRNLMFSGTVANGAQVNLLCGTSNGITVAQVTVMGHGATKDEGGTVLYGNGTGFLVGGTANFAVGSGAGKLNILCNSQVNILNSTGETLTYVASVVCQ